MDKLIKKWLDSLLTERLNGVYCSVKFPIQSVSSCKEKKILENTLDFSVKKFYILVLYKCRNPKMLMVVGVDPSRRS